MDSRQLCQYLADTPVTDARYYETVGSTNDEAASWADLGAPDGALVVADEQTRGRGRNRRRWITRPGSSLAFSIVFRPDPEKAANIAFYSPLCALAVGEMLEKIGLHPLIKWPNDVLIDRKKISGVLVEGSWQAGTIGAVICGIGINIASDSLNPSDGLLFPASSIERELGGKPVDRWEVLHEVAQGLFRWRACIGREEFLRAWESRLAFRGEWVRIEQNGREPLVGIVDGIDPKSGSLRLATASGGMEFIEAGDVHLRPAENG